MPLPQGTAPDTQAGGAADRPGERPDRVLRAARVHARPAQGHHPLGAARGAEHRTGHHRRHPRPDPRHQQSERVARHHQRTDAVVELLRAAHPYGAAPEQRRRQYPGAYRLGAEQQGGNHPANIEKRRERQDQRGAGHAHPRPGVYPVRLRDREDSLPVW